MVLMAVSLLQFLEENAIQSAINFYMQPIAHRRYVDYRFKCIEDAHSFKDILNSQDPQIQYTMKIESFLDITCTNNKTGK